MAALSASRRRSYHDAWASPLASTAKPTGPSPALSGSTTQLLPRRSSSGPSAATEKGAGAASSPNPNDDTGDSVASGPNGETKRLMSPRATPSLGKHSPVTSAIVL